MAYNIISKDGYIVGVYNIPRKRPTKGVVFLLHPATSTPAVWIDKGVNRSLGNILLKILFTNKKRFCFFQLSYFMMLVSMYGWEIRGDANTAELTSDLIPTERNIGISRLYLVFGSRHLI